MMTTTMLLEVLALSVLPSAGNLLGSLAAEWKRVPPKAVGMLLHGAAGVAIAVVSVEIMPRVLDDSRPWTMGLAFAAGASVSLLMASLARGAASALALDKARPLMVTFAVATDLFSDGLMVGIGTAVSEKLGLLLALGQVVANVPGGFATTSNLRRTNVGRGVRALLAFATCMASLSGGTIGFLLLREGGESMRGGALAFIVGLLLLATVEDVVPEGDAPRAGRTSTTTAFTIGFLVFALVAIYT